MEIEMLHSKIHRVTVTEADPDYVGSITVDPELLEAAGILEYQKVQVVDINNGNRLDTYTICGEKGSGVICLNGAAARLVEVGDKVILMSYASMAPADAKDYKPTVVFVDDDNKITRVAKYEKCGSLYIDERDYMDEFMHDGVLIDV